MSNELFDKLIYTDEEIDDELLTAIIKAGSHEYIKNTITKPTEEELANVSFSDVFEKRMQKQFDLFEYETKKERRINLFIRSRNVIVKIAAAMFVIIALSSVFIATSEAAQKKVINTLIEVFDIKTDFRFTDSGNHQANETSLSSMLGYMPDGFEIINEINNKMGKRIEYKNNTGCSISFIQQEGGSSSIDTENANTYEILIGDYNCFVSEKDDEIIIVFNDNLYAYTLYSNLALEEIKKIILNFN